MWVWPIPGEPGPDVGLGSPEVSLIYRVMYRIGFTPWDTGVVPEELSALVEGDEALPAGRALDIGCGTGTQSVYLAQHGWRVTAIDAVGRPLVQARARADAAHVDVEWLNADVSELASLGIEPGLTLAFDRGCFHGLNDRERAAYAAGVTSLAAPGATLLLMSFAPSRVPGGPRGVEETELAARFDGWALSATQPDNDGDPAGPMRNVPRHWYRLTRR
jgi:SAM-dependent methyltransferase